MNKTTNPQTKLNISQLSNIFFWLGGIESLIAAAFLLSLPSESSGFGLSPARLAILTAILLLGGVCAGLAILQARKQIQIAELPAIKKAPSLIGFSSLAASAVCALIPFLLQDLFSSTGVYYYLAYSQRLSPFLFYLALLLFQITIFLALIHHERIKQLLSSEKPFLKTWALTYGGLLALVLIICVTRLGLTPDPLGWGAPTVPLLEWQIWLCIVISLSFRLAAGTQVFRRVSSWKTAHSVLFGWVISLFVWGLAMGLWASQPVPPGFFATPPRAPNFEIYPFSDAAFYDFHAQSMLIGQGFRGDSIPPRPLYIVFLAATHLIAGQEYTRVILLQTAFLAFLPVIIFWIGKKLSSSIVGILASLFIIFREWTSIVSTPFTSDVSNSKLLFADLPAALVISLVLLISIYWLKKPRNLLFSLLAGGILGISLLIRTQIIILLPVILVFFWIESLRQKVYVRSLVIPTLLCLLGFGLAVSPWLSRSYRITGQFVFDHPESQTRVMAQRFYPDVEMTDFDRKPGETTGVYNQRLSAAIRDQILSHPADVIHFIMSHWLNSEIANLQIFPIRYSITNLTELFKPQHAFWEEWDGNATPMQTGIMLLNLCILTAGLVFLTMRNSWVGLLPFIFNLAYHFSNAGARNSGWRYLLPADWIFLVYFAAGIYAIVNLGIRSGITVNTEPEPTDKSVNVFILAATAVGIFCIGFLPLLAETSFPQVYPKTTVQNTRQVLINSAVNISSEDQQGLTKLLDDPNVVVMNGRMLYPRYYGEKEGEEKTGKTGYAPLPYSRYVFLVAGDPEGTVIFPHVNPELPLRNAHDVFLIGCMDGLAVKARMVVLPDENSAVYTASPSLPWGCSELP
jgi:hypothetical protein